MRFEIGQEVWRATFEATTARICCPDCAGTGRMRVIFADDSVVSVDCGNCSRGYEAPTGWVRVYDRVGRAVPCTIKGMEVNGDKVEWKTNDCYSIEEEKLFETEAEALAAAQVMAAQHDAEEREKVWHKEKDTRSWAWNATYHRNCIKRAQKEIEYHTAKLAVANLKAKQDKATSPVPSPDIKSAE